MRTLWPCEKSRGSSLSRRESFPEDSIIFPCSIEMLSRSSIGRSDMILSSTPLYECVRSVWGVSVSECVCELVIVRVSNGVSGVGRARR